VQIQDGSGNLVPTGGVEIRVDLNSGEGSLGGILQAETDSAGMAEFEDLYISGSAGARTLLFTAGGLTGIVSDPVEVTAGKPHCLGLASRPPSKVQPGVAFDRHPELELLDENGNRVRQSGIVVMVAMTEGDGTLGGTLMASTNEDGLAAFADLGIVGPTGERTLEFTAPGLVSVSATTMVEEEKESSLLIPEGGSDVEVAVGVTAPVGQAGFLSRLRSRLRKVLAKKRPAGATPPRSKDVPHLVFGGSAASYPRPESAPPRLPEISRPKPAADPGAEEQEEEDLGPVQRATLQMLPGRLEPMDKDVIQQEVRFLRGEGDTHVVTLGWDMAEPPGHVTLDHPSVQPKHARMTFRDGRWWIESLSEFYPVEVNDVPLQLTQEPVLLENGDRVRFGEAVFRFWMS
jgi:hypothetical protein